MIVKVSLALGVLSLVLPRLVIALAENPKIYSYKNVPVQPVAIVFGAGLLKDGTPTAVLRDRVSTAAALFFAGKVEKILMSGDNRYTNYNEPAAMRDFALQLGVPGSAIVTDYAGRRTYDTCYRAAAIFGIRQAILVTQGFHLPRALYTCTAFGINASGVPADLQTYRPASALYWNLREMPATLTAFIQVNFTRPLPVLGQPEPIFSTHSQ